jgi:hypothetical protein
VHKRENKVTDPSLNIKFSETLDLSSRKVTKECHESTRQASLERDSNRSLERAKRPSLCETLIKAPIRSNNQIYRTQTSKSRSAMKIDPQED